MHRRLYGGCDFRNNVQHEQRSSETQHGERSICSEQLDRAGQQAERPREEQQHCQREAHLPRQVRNDAEAFTGLEIARDPASVAASTAACDASFDWASANSGAPGDATMNVLPLLVAGGVASSDRLSAWKNSLTGPTMAPAVPAMLCLLRRRRSSN